MLDIIGCFVRAHDFRLVALAVVICALGSMTAIELLCHVSKASGRGRVAWLAVAAVAGGGGTWATHFIAMLAFMPGVPTGYDVGLTVISLLLAILLVGLGLTIAISKPFRRAVAAGGVIVGLGVAAMHYTGMAAFEAAGRIVWNPWIIGISMISGVGLSAGALVEALRRPGLANRLAGAGLLLLSICTLHFVGMAAVTIVPDPMVDISSVAVPTHFVAMAVAAASLIILILAGSALALDVRDRRRATVEAERMRSLANAAVEGLVVCQGEVIVSSNDSFASLVGASTPSLSGASLSTFLPQWSILGTLLARLDHPIETLLRRADGTDIPVELIMRALDYANTPHHAIAVRDLRARRKAEGQIHYLAHHDALTGLANRLSFNKRLEQELNAAEDRGGRLAVLCLDLDRFKEVNDLYGHATGDAMLQNVARVVTSVLREDQMMARLGGDEFAIVLACDAPAEPRTLAASLIEALQRDGLVQAGPAIATSIGIALYPDDAQDQKTLLSAADTALYRAKAEGRGTFRVFESWMGSEARDQRLLEIELRQALLQGELHLVYQPQVQAEKGVVTGLEALIRWTHPVRGVIPPAVFIPLAEESGLILKIGEWVLRETCAEAARWEAQLAIAVNISAMQLHHPDFGRLVQGVLAETRLDPRRLELEVTETALIRDPIRALATLRQLKGLGVSIAMDDFGTGYSSLSNLRSFPFDRIKIDGSFVKAVDSNAQAAAIVRSVLGLGRGLGLSVIAEGVETEAELRFLRSERCEAVQGYLTGRPQPIEQLSEFTLLPPPTASQAA